MVQFSVTYEIVTQESAEQGDAEERVSFARVQACAMRLQT
jgi:hypothetical protein